MILQLTLIKPELHLIIELCLSYNPKPLEETKTTSCHGYLFGTGLIVEIHSFSNTGYFAQNG